jgi:hypothetical protein
VHAVLGVEECERVPTEEKALEKRSTQSSLGSRRISNDRTKLLWITNKNESLDTAGHKWDVRFRFKRLSGFVHKAGIEMSALKRRIRGTGTRTADDRYRAECERERALQKNPVTKLIGFR